MTIQKLGIFGPAKTEAEISEELRAFFESKKVEVGEPTEDPFANVKQFTEAAEKLAPSLGEKEVELLFNAIFNLSITMDRDPSVKFNELLCKTFKGPAFKGTGWNSHAGVAVRVLSNIFHMYTDQVQIQLPTFKTLLEIAGSAGLTQFVDVSLSTVQSYAAEWGLDAEQERELLRHLHNALIADKRTNVAFEVMMALLRTYTEVDADRAKEDARECVRTAIVDPNSFSVDHLLRLIAVQRLEKSDPKIHQLLMLFASGKLTDYRKFIDENASYVRDQLKVDEGELEKKFKMLSLISLAEQQQTLPLDKLSKELEISDHEDLEEFLIDAVRIGAVNGKINEQNNEFVVTTFQYRSFGRPQWELLQKRLSSLLKNLKASHNNLVKVTYDETRPA